MSRRVRSNCRISATLAATLLALAAAAGAQNGIVNGDFDESATGWSSPAGDLTWSSAVDVDGCVGSGSALVGAPEFVASDWTATAVSSGSCLDVTPGEVIHLDMWLKVLATVAHTDFYNLVYSDDACTAGETEVPTVGYNEMEPLDWIHFQMGGTVQDGTGSMRFLLRFTDASRSDYEVALDSIYVGRGQPIFRDGFEANGVGTDPPCRWSDSVMSAPSIP